MRGWRLALLIYLALALGWVGSAQAIDLGAGLSQNATTGAPQAGIQAYQKDVSPLTPLTVASGIPVYCGLDGSCSLTTNGPEVQTPLTDTGTISKILCEATAGTTNAIKVEVFSGTCGGALAGGTLTQTMSTSAWTSTDSTGSTDWADKQCVVLKYTVVTTAAKSILRCTVKITAGT